MVNKAKQIIAAFSALLIIIIAISVNGFSSYAAEADVPTSKSDLDWVMKFSYDDMMSMLAAQTKSYVWAGSVLTRIEGVNEGPNGTETYYNLDMSLCITYMKDLGYDYDYWVRDDGVKMYGPYIMCAADLDVHPKGSLVESSLGTCIVCDTGTFAEEDPDQIDVAVTW